MSTKLTYFDFHGGRGEPVRLALSIGNIPFEDERISFQQFGEMKPSLPFNAVPVLEMDGMTFCQSNAMLRYVGPKAGLWPSEPKDQVVCDEMMGALEDLSHYFGATFGLKDDALKAARTTLCETRYAPFLKSFAARVEATEGPFLSGKNLSVGDLKLFAFTRFLKSGTADHVPTDIVESCAPALAAHRDAVAAHPGVASYYASKS